MKKTALAVVFACSCICAMAQDSAAIKLHTADSLASGNYKDVLTSFFQLAFQNLTGPEKEFKFTSNPFAIMARANPKLLVDTNYRQHLALRRLNFAFGIRLADDFDFNGFSSGINYSIINKRDHTIYRDFPKWVRQRNQEFELLHRKMDSARSRLDIDDPARRLMREQVDSLLNYTSYRYSSLNPKVKAIMEQIIAQYGLQTISALRKSNDQSFRAAIDQNFEDVKDSLKNKLLWTVGVSDTTYNDQLMFSNIVFSTQLLKGITNPKSNHGLEIDIRGAYNIIDDTLSAGRDLRRNLLGFEGGFNYVWRSKRTDLSFFEVKMSAAYNKIFNGIYADERSEVFTLNGTLRVRVFDDVWVPVQIKYDPKTGNVFGFLNVRANFTALKKAITGGLLK
jgi:hypothetical protein